MTNRAQLRKSKKQPGNPERPAGVSGNTWRQPCSAGRSADRRTLTTRDSTDRRVRIALISTPFLAVPPRPYGGTELVVYELAEGLVRLGHDVEIFATGDSQTSGTLRSLYDEIQWPPDSLADLNHVSWAMNEVSLRGSFDVIHAHSAAALACARLVPGVPM